MNYTWSRPLLKKRKYEPDGDSSEDEVQQQPRSLKHIKKLDLSPAHQESKNTTVYAIGRTLPGDPIEGAEDPLANGSVQDVLEVDEDDDSMAMLLELWQQHKVSRQIEASKRSWVYRDPTKRTSGVCCRCGKTKAFLKIANDRRDGAELQCNDCGHSKCPICVVSRSRSGNPEGKKPAKDSKKLD